MNCQHYVMGLVINTTFFLWRIESKVSHCSYYCLFYVCLFSEVTMVPSMALPFYRNVLITCWIIFLPSLLTSHDSSMDLKYWWCASYSGECGGYGESCLCFGALLWKRLITISMQSYCVYVICSFSSFQFKCNPLNASPSKCSDTSQFAFDASVQLSACLSPIDLSPKSPRANLNFIDHHWCF